ncbi:hypothetical protein PV416_32205 [Streptomyces ipomoeae]|uniref:Uncharacterized protein n=1 Tax=Streptomyces ipomoeae 91-03 TaxID=698759 RepID=L1L030_9ACTN|nr:hypothetical protein [Streptomyces ipomoeae]EKX65958.1 hypothetical protein STRIP9103_03451 [Streptomyces ipomoeae 91-03]MDX2698374.1 hypothetical protein [Streptomyces ipomoeae]MDX2825612.1 hypothetical protein [Streptomyces ipomoeae]MDX2843883.1 hypothetical protein [Streptomyces ipomoeae]MDX2878255.1 hypothetical protein [Streptomyces ipomoeae]
MESVVVLSLLPVAVVAAVVIRQLLLYPVRWGDWRYAFGSEHAEKRRELHEVRLRRRDVERNSRRKIAQAKTRVTGVEQEGRQQVQALERERKELLREVIGEQRGRLGELVLYEHALHFMGTTQDGQEVLEEPRLKLPLQGLKAKAVLSGDPSFIRVTWPKGRQSAEYPRHDKREVESFANQIYTEVLRDAEYRENRERQAADIEARIQKIQTETAQRKAERERERDELIKALHPNRRQAEADWTAACAVWQGHTRRRPGWLWRW